MLSIATINSRSQKIKPCTVELELSKGNRKRPGIRQALEDDSVRASDVNWITDLCLATSRDHICLQISSPRL